MSTRERRRNEFERDSRSGLGGEESGEFLFSSSDLAPGLFNEFWPNLCFDFVAVTSQRQSAFDEDWALALAREAVIRPLTNQAELTEGLVARRAPISGSFGVLFTGSFHSYSEPKLYDRTEEQPTLDENEKISV